ncbi:hypothetical protein O0547_26935 [Brevibacillus laterosporus]|uniref:hypothetical protein n=1 Tax=Brevibacillus laterosporus TaxID=1465 RepID=UPI0022A7D09C|nr:hypothetical protein [Brevibacillus laterosporus]MCZ0828266.1 hypothetical protein [Brevibacillus laterosporus]MCZ0853201.1 hypothetical protein [Brevibacillus laterosporus]
MRLQARVVNRFKAMEHDGHIYEPGDIYPAEGYTADTERVTLLSELHPHYQKIYLSDIQEFKDTGNQFPKHIGGGFYELSNGEKVKGKEEASEAENALKE